LPGGAVNDIKVVLALLAMKKVVQHWPLVSMVKNKTF
jgi:hypothetical protein